MEKIIQCSKSYCADVVVIGAGVAGFGAAVSAGRRGLKTILLESGNKIGGVLADCPFMPFGGGYTKNDGIAIGGIFEELVQNLYEMKPTVALRRASLLKEFGDELHYDHEKLLLKMHDMLEQSEVQVATKTTVFDVEMRHDNIVALYALQGDDFVRVEGTVFVDCSGNGIVAHKAGVPYKIGIEGKGVMGGGYTFVCYGVAPSFFEQKEDVLNKNILRRGVEEGKIDNRLSYVYVIQGYRDDIGIVNTITVTNVDGTDNESTVAATNEGRKMAHALSDYLLDNVPEFKNATVAYMSPSIGIRETRRFEGLYELSADDIMNQHFFPDGICICGNPIGEVARGSDGKPLLIVSLGRENGDCYSVPFRSLVPRKIENLMFAGRILCSDPDGMASARGMPTCMLMGQACGIAAKMIIEKKTLVQKLDFHAISEQMIAEGANGLR